jgi:hypothetical protein
MKRNETKRLVILVWLLSILLAAIHCWFGRHTMNPDGVTYMDISDAYRAGHWKEALNGYRSPLYSWILLPALAIEASPEAEFARVHAVNFLIFLVTLFCFHFLLIGVMNAHSQSVFPDWALVVAAYALFLWSSLTVITLELVTPDLCVAAILYAATGMLLRIRQGDGRWAIFLLLGLILGIGYLAKAALLAFAPLMVILCALAIGDARKAIPKLMLLSFGFAIVAIPWIYGLSSSKGRFTFGDAGKLAYGWAVQGVPMLHWHGGPAANGVPAHPDRQIYSHPNAYEFASPNFGTYPPSYDFSYWAEGIIVRPELRTHIRRLGKSLREYLSFYDEQLSGVLAVVFLLWLLGDRKAFWRNLGEEWRLLIPVSYGFVLYAQVWVDWRYFGAYLTLFWIALLCALRIPEFERRGQVTGAAAAAIVAVLGFHICAFSYARIRQQNPMEEHLRVVSVLRSLEIDPGSPVASIGDASQAYWARLGRLRIVAEIPFALGDPVLQVPGISDVDVFWATSAEERRAVMRKLAETGAKAVIARDVPLGPAGLGWQKVTGTPYSIYHL